MIREIEACDICLERERVIDRDHYGHFYYSSGDTWSKIEDTVVCPDCTMIILRAFSMINICQLELEMQKKKATMSEAPYEPLPGEREK